MRIIEKAKCLTARNLVFAPGSLLLVSIITSEIAIAVTGALQTIMWVLALLLLASSLYFIYRCICAIEFFSNFIDLSTLMEQALERHKIKTTPSVDIDFFDFQLTVKRGEITKIDVWASLRQGSIARNAKVRFSGTEELDFPEEETEQLEYDYRNMKKPKQFWSAIGDINPGVEKHHIVKVKAPDMPGEYTMAYWIQCDEFTSEEKTFKIKVT